MPMLHLQPPNIKVEKNTNWLWFVLKILRKEMFLFTTANIMKEEEEEVKEE